MLTLSPLVLQLVSLGISVAPELISLAQTEIDLVNSSTPPTAEQAAAISAAMDAAHAALQSAEPAPG